MRFWRYALIVGMVVLFAGCGGSQSIGAPGPMPQSRTIATYAERGRSWMLPEAKSEDLLYISSEDRGSVYVYTYPKGILAGTLENLNTAAEGECVNRAGDVFITTVNSSATSTIYRYAHGGTSPIATLSDPGEANGCSVDPTTGNLAVTNLLDETNPYYGNNGDLAVYAGAKGNPVMYYFKGNEIRGFEFCGYDDKGNLYLSAADDYHLDNDLVRLSSGSRSFDLMNLNTKLDGLSSVQWYGKHLTVTSNAGRKPITVYRLRVSGNKATVVGSTTLSTAKNDYDGQTWIQGRTIIGTGQLMRSFQNAFFWPFPKGGEPRGGIEKVGEVRQILWGVTVSVAHSR